MSELKGLFIEDEVANISVYTKLFELEGLQLEDFADQFGDYDYELKKDAIVERYADVAEKIKRACELRKENAIYKGIEQQEEEESDTIKLLREISAKLDSKE